MNHRVLFALIVSSVLVSAPHQAYQSAPEDPLRAVLAAHAVPLQGAGEARLLSESHNHDFFLLGELHGETEIPALLRDLWPQLWRVGYRHVAAEISPSAAERLGQRGSRDKRPIDGLWTRDQAATVGQFAAPNELVLRGCDIEEGQPESLILNIAALNPEDRELQKMVEITRHRYKRKQAPELLRLAEGDDPVHDAMVGGISLWQNLRDTLRIETLRSQPRTKLTASEARELVMKQLFLGPL
jgi:hypothetical protein